MESKKNPLCILLVSGKRKCGKDYFAEKVVKTNGTDEIIIIRISAPIKSHFAKSMNLNLEELMGNGVYKEAFRERMIVWGNEMREKDPGVFCRAAIEMSNAHSKKVWIVSDVRRKTDIKWFRDNFGDAVKTIRMEANNDIRKERGWSFVSGIDDVASECDLDDFENWDWKFQNNGDEKLFGEAINKICDYIRKVVS